MTPLPEDLLQAHHIALTDLSPGRHYTTCPECSSTRTNAHRTLKCLGITIEVDGRVRWGCSHCSWQGPQKGAGAKAKGASKPELSAYVYRDTHGEPRFRKVRNLPGRPGPRFWLEQADGSGGWRKGTAGVDTGLLYRADEIAKEIAAGRLICLVEGEKDADNLWRLGFASTCNAHGASEFGKTPKWTAKHSEQLKDADIIVLNDEDSSGYAHADATCKLSLGIARRVRRLILKEHWPDIPQGGDVSDWLAQGRTREELQALVDGAPDYAPATSARQGKAASGDEATDNNGDLDEAEEAEIERLAKLRLVAYDRERKGTAQKLRLRASMLDKVVTAKRAELGLVGLVDDGLPGRPLTFETIEVWDDPVDGAELLTELSEAIGKYIVMNKHQCDGAALWAAHAHAHDFRDLSPPLVIKSPAMRSGKSKLIEVFERLVPRPLYVSGITVSFLERAIEAERPTLLIDEFDALTSNDPALAEAARAQLNRSAKRRGASVGKNVPLPGGGYAPRMFSTWAPTVLAGIGDPAATIRDRAVVIELKRKLSSETVKPLRERDGGDLVIFRRQLARFVADNEQRLRDVIPAPLAIDNDRAKDMWEQLLAVAEVAGGDWPKRAREAGQALAHESETETTEADVKLLLLADIRDIFAKEPEPDPLDMLEPDKGGRPDHGQRISTKHLIEKLVELEERPWSAWGRAKNPLTGKALSDLLKPYKVRSNDVRIGGASAVKGYYLRSFTDVFARYLPRSGNPSAQGSANPGKQGESEDFQHPNKPPLSDFGKTRETPANPGFAGLCADEKGGVRGSASICPAPTPPEGRPLLSQERVEAAEGAGCEFHLSERGFSWIYAVGVNPNDPNLQLAEDAVAADRAGVEEFLRWRLARGGAR